jgi:phage terminase small subunit
MPNVKGATRKPTALLALTGALDKKPGRYASRKSEPKPTSALGDPPAHFDAGHQAVWHEVANQCAPGVLFGSDRILMELICTLICKSRSGVIRALEQNLLLACLQQLGMSPISRSRIAVPESGQKDDTWASLLHPVPSTRMKQ